MKKRQFLIVSLCAALLVMSILIVTLRPKRQVLYKVTYLPSVGKEFFLPCSINDKGQIAGFAKVAYCSHHLFLWDREKGLQDLGPVFNDQIHINNTGQIAVTMQDPNGHEHAFIWDPNYGRCILPTLGGKTSTAHSINNHGQVVGTAETASDILHACVWNTNSEIQDLTPFSQKHTRAWSINDAGQVVVFTPSGHLLLGVNAKISTSQPIPVRGLAEINSNGYVAGLGQAGPGKHDIVVWHSDSGQKKLVQLKTNISSDTNINDVNQVLLTKGRQPKFRLLGRNFVSTHVENYLHDPKHGWLSLNKYVDFGPHEDLCLTDLNNKGCIVGVIQSRKESCSRGVLLEPIPKQWEK